MRSYFVLGVLLAMASAMPCTAQEWRCPDDKHAGCFYDPVCGWMKNGRLCANATKEERLMAAVSDGNATMVSSLLRDGVNAKLQFTNGTTALMVAAYHGHETIMQMLMNAGAKAFQASN